MNHFIQPIEIPTAPFSHYCMTQHGGRATIGIATSIITEFPFPPDVSNPESPWEVDFPGFGGSEISFGVGCGDEVILSVSTTGEPTDPGYPAYGVVIDTYINGVYYSTSSFSDTSPPSSGNIVISLSDVACGNVVTLAMSSSAECYATITIDSIT